MNNQKIYKFEVGERLRIKENLIINKLYHMSHDKSIFNIFSKRMSVLAGKEAMVMDIVSGYYRLSVDRNNMYTDGMLDKMHDVEADEEYKCVQEVEEIIKYMSRLIPEQLINHALDTGDKEMFMRLTEQFKKGC
jgi:hypothetical protein